MFSLKAGKKKTSQIWGKCSQLMKHLTFHFLLGQYQQHIWEQITAKEQSETIQAAFETPYVFMELGLL